MPNVAGLCEAVVCVLRYGWKESRYPRWDEAWCGYSCDAFPNLDYVGLRSEWSTDPAVERQGAMMTTRLLLEPSQRRVEIRLAIYLEGIGAIHTRNVWISLGEVTLQEDESNGIDVEVLICVLLQVKELFDDPYTVVGADAIRERFLKLEDLLQGVGAELEASFLRTAIDANFPETDTPSLENLQL